MDGKGETSKEGVVCVKTYKSAHKKLSTIYPKVNFAMEKLEIPKGKHAWEFVVRLYPGGKPCARSVVSFDRAFQLAWNKQIGR